MYLYLSTIIITTKVNWSKKKILINNRQMYPIKKPLTKAKKLPGSRHYGTCIATLGDLSTRRPKPLIFPTVLKIVGLTVLIDRL